jgi:hypothetical protein
MALLSVKIEGPSHVASPGLGKNNVYGHALFSDGKRYRFRYHEEGYSIHIKLWRPGADDKPSSEIEVCAPKRNELIAMALDPMIAELVAAGVAAKAAEDAEREAWQAECHAAYIKREAGDLAHDALVEAERFVAGFEDDELQAGVAELLAKMRAAIAAGLPGQKRVDFIVYKAADPIAKHHILDFDEERAWKNWSMSRAQRPNRADYVVERYKQEAA